MARTIAFFSYTRADDEASGRLISKIHTSLEAKLRSELGQDVELFQDVDDIKQGENWRQKLARALDEAVHLVPVLSPRFVASEPCREELAFFLRKAANAWRPDIVFPILWVKIRELSRPERVAQDPLLAFIEATQWVDWTEHRHKPTIDGPLLGQIGAVAESIADRLHDDSLAPTSPLGGMGLAAAPSMAETTLHVEALLRLGVPEEEAQRRQAKPRFATLSVFRDPLEGGGEGPEMVVIPAGRFLMGSPNDEPGREADEGPQHEVTVRSFALGQFPVTFDEYDGFCAAIGREQPEDAGWGRGERPVINVSWEDASAYCEWLSDQTGAEYRLPTEAEWEYACRAGTTTRYSIGDASRRLSDHAWFRENSGKKTQPVGDKQGNAFGLHDMHGNVWEWCADTWNESYAGAPTDGSAWTSGDTSRAVLRGGSWDDEAQNLRSANRNWFRRVGRYDGVGFRLARTLPGD